MLSESGTPTQSTPNTSITSCPFAVKSAQTHHSCDRKYSLRRKQHPCLACASSHSLLNLHRSQPRKALSARKWSDNCTKVWMKTNKVSHLKLLQCFSCFLWSIVNSFPSSQKSQKKTKTPKHFLLKQLKCICCHRLVMADLKTNKPTCFAIKPSLWSQKSDFWESEKRELLDRLKKYFNW